MGQNLGLLREERPDGTSGRASLGRQYRKTLAAEVLSLNLGEGAPVTVTAVAMEQEGRRMSVGVAVVVVGDIGLGVMRPAGQMRSVEQRGNKRPPGDFEVKLLSLRMHLAEVAEEVDAAYRTSRRTLSVCDLLAESCAALALWTKS
jgi:hypothetical protein